MMLIIFLQMLLFFLIKNDWKNGVSFRPVTELRQWYFSVFLRLRPASYLC